MILSNLHKIFPVRSRYVMTRGSMPRLRVLAVPATTGAVWCAVMAASLPLQTNDNAYGSLTSASLTAEMLDIESPQVKDARVSEASLIEPEVKISALDAGQYSYTGTLFSSYLMPKIDKAPASAFENNFDSYEEDSNHRVVMVEPGDTLGGLLQKEGIDGADAYKIVEAIAQHHDPRNLKPGQKVELTYDPVTRTGVEEVSINIDHIRGLVVRQIEGGKFDARVTEKEVFAKTQAGRFVVQNTLYGSAAVAGIPDRIVANVMKTYSWGVDFERDIRSGDTMEVYYEVFETEDGQFVDYGDILYARLKTGSKDLPIYRFETEDGRTEYFDEKGQSIKKALLKTPVNNARKSSGFGYRKHPVLGYKKLHKGVDFAAPTGTPILASGDGVIERANRYSSYGNYVLIRHNNNLKTAYAHMKGFAKGIKAGTRVTQGQVIGYVGTTGRSTGPHLHYEVLVGGKQVNPNSVDLPTGIALAGSDLNKFKKSVSTIKASYAANVSPEAVKLVKVSAKASADASGEKKSAGL